MFLEQGSQLKVEIHENLNILWKINGSSFCSGADLLLSLQIHYETEELLGPRCHGCRQKAGSALVSVLGLPAVPLCIPHLWSTQNAALPWAPGCSWTKQEISTCWGSGCRRCGGAEPFGSGDRKGKAVPWQGLSVLAQVNNKWGKHWVVSPNPAASLGVPVPAWGTQSCSSSLQNSKVVVDFLVELQLRERTSRAQLLDFWNSLSWDKAAFNCDWFNCPVFGQPSVPSSALPEALQTEKGKCIEILKNSDWTSEGNCICIFLEH